MLFSDYIVFVDESGDHNLEVVNHEFPVFVLAFCVFKKNDYSERICPSIQKFKLRWYGHDACILHEREIRKDLPPFGFLKTPSAKERFIGDLTSIIAETSMVIIATVIRKGDLKAKYSSPDNLTWRYYFALSALQPTSPIMDKLGASPILSLSNEVVNLEADRKTVYWNWSSGASWMGSTIWRVQDSLDWISK